ALATAQLQLFALVSKEHEVKVTPKVGAVTTNDGRSFGSIDSAVNNMVQDGTLAMTIPATADTTQADDVMVRWRNEQTGETVIKPVGANPGPAFREVERFGAVIGRQTHDTNIGADLGPARREIEEWDPPPVEVEVEIDWSGVPQWLGGTGSRASSETGNGLRRSNPWNTGKGGIDGNVWTPFSTGGLVG